MAEEVQVALPVLRASSVLFPRRMMLNTFNSLPVSKKQYLSSGPQQLSTHSQVCKSSILVSYPGFRFPQACLHLVAIADLPKPAPPIVAIAAVLKPASI